MLNKQEHFCHFCVLHSRTNNDYSTEQPLGFLSPRIAYITKGSCVMTTPNGLSLTVNAGDVWYIPKNQPYSSVWTAEEYVEFYYFEFESDFFSTEYSFFQVIKDSDLLPHFIKLYENFKEQNRMNAVAEFYHILSDLSTKLKMANNEKVESILPALQYLHKNYKEHTKVSTLAKLCYLSESYFYSTFKNIMKQSPIEYKNNLKISRAIELLQSGYTLEKICDELNFSSTAFLRTMIIKYTGKSPRTLKKVTPL
jgi:YesN/AraC family two-component response regulator